MARTRARNLSAEDISDIVSLLDGWSGKLSWELLIQAIGLRKRATYTRQALHKHERIKHAFAVRKRLLGAGRGNVAPKVGSPELASALQRIARLEGENARLESENQRLLEQFARWAYNAHTRGLDQQFLSRPLPPVNRDRTVLATDRSKGVRARE